MSQIEDYEQEIDKIARVLAVHKGVLEVHNGEISAQARLPESINMQPTVGDFVLLDGLLDSDSLAVKQVYERKSLLQRMAAGNRSQVQPIAANVDYALIVTSMNDEFNLSRLERYLLAIQESGATPVVVLSKQDLCDNPDDYIEQVERIARGVQIIPISAPKKLGLDKLLSLLSPGATLVAIGSSGVGKSTLVNYICGEDMQKTQAISFFDKGSHTTTSRQMLQAANGSLVIDTPGMREFQPIVQAETISEAFDDIESKMPHCRYRNCSHTVEDGCAILKAIEAGDIDDRRWKNYQKMQREQDRRNQAFKQNSKLRWKKVHLDMRQRKKMEDRS
ncbi:ribosome small subunit-dependent GTPase A [Pseudobacteriovorax antillogorgiicola]|nr:ribosome small subunit-dependent GTPase A [Pseudobacteriovorax antillogorgiicola]